MTSLKKNILANFAGKSVQAVLIFIYIPLYIYFLGIQDYAIIGFYITLQSIFFIFDAGLSTTLNRELARLSAQTGYEKKAYDLVRTLEIIYFAIACIIAILIILLSPLISKYWITTGNIPSNTLFYVVIMMGIAIAFQFPYSLYSGGLIGLQKQVLLNILDSIFALTRGLGSVLVLWLISPTLQAFFTWQIIVNLFQTIIYAYFLWNSLPRADAKPRFNMGILHEIWIFTAGISGINIFAIILSQMDKIILSKMLALDIFGYYMVATSLSSTLGLMTVPLFMGVFPRLSQLVLGGTEDNLKKLYHQSCQLMSVLVLPLSITIILFSKEILLLWTNNTLIANYTNVIVSLLVIGTTFNALMIIPYALQLANGWTKLALYQNFFSLIILIPLIVILTINYGVIGAAFVWIILNGGYVLIGLYIMHKRLLKNELKKWYIVDLGLPLVGALIIPTLARLYMPITNSAIVVLIELIIILTVSMTVTAVITPFTRSMIIYEYKLLLLRSLKAISIFKNNYVK